MAFLSDREREIVEAIASLATGNPFLPERVQKEQSALGEHFRPISSVWHEGGDLEAGNPNVEAVGVLAEELAPQLRQRLEQGTRASEAELRAYQGLVFYLLYYRNLDVFQQLIEAGRLDPRPAPLSAYTRYRKDVAQFLEIGGAPLPFEIDPAHLFAWGYQVRRAFEGTFRGIHGGSMPAAQLRASVWESIFTHDSQRYGRVLYDRMSDVTTLVLGESGTGKELVARAIGMARYVPFDPHSRRFAENPESSFHAVNLAALSPTLIESELFGHGKGAYTGALQDRVGWLESCSPLGTVFLDEIGDLDGAIQVKLLRVLQSRVFQRVGETRERRFEGKLIAATHRDLPAEMEGERFRADLYYRLCADVVRTPSLRQQIADSPEELPGLISLLARRIVGDEDAPELTAEVVSFVREKLGSHYAWPGNVRELEQCVRNVLIRGRYEAPPARRFGAPDELAEQVRTGSLDAELLLRRYCTQVYAECGSYEETGRRLGLDRRTVKARIDPEWLERLSTT